MRCRNVGEMIVVITLLIISSAQVSCVDGPKVLDVDTLSLERIRMLTSANFDSAITGDYRLAMVDFFSSECGRCQVLAPVIDTLALTLPADILIGKVNIIEEISLRDSFAIQEYPTVVYFKNGLEIHRTVDPKSAGFIRGVIDSLLQVP